MYRGRGWRVLWSWQTHLLELSLSRLVVVRFFIYLFKFVSIPLLKPSLVLWAHVQVSLYPVSLTYPSPTGYVVVIFRFFFRRLRYILYIPLKQWVISPKSWTSTGYFSNSIGSFCKVEPPITNHLRNYVLALEQYKAVQNFLMQEDRN